jgi:hypothetical protein
MFEKEEIKNIRWNGLENVRERLSFPRPGDKLGDVRAFGVSPLKYSFQYSLIEFRKFWITSTFQIFE